MRGLRSASYFCYRCLFRDTLPECRPAGWSGACRAIRRMSHNTPCLQNNLPQAKEIPREVTEFDLFGTIEKRIPARVTSFADIVDRSPILQKLVDLGVEIHKFNKDWDLCKFILQLDYKKNVEPYLSFLRDHGVRQEFLPSFITENPYILLCDLDDLQVRINYLHSKSFTKEMIAQVINGNPKWLSFEVKKIDGRLGDLQKMLHLSGSDVRAIAVKYPRVANVVREKLHLNILMFRDQLGLTKSDVKKIFINKPVLLARDPNESMQSFYYLQDEMKVPVDLVIKQPEIIVRKVHFLSLRHKFLVKLGRAQYDPKQPGYVSMENLANMDDESFCKNIALTDLEKFHNFEKTL